MSGMTTRRDFLKIAAMLSGAAGVSGFVPDSVQRAFAIEPEPGSTYRDAEHIVILMQENRSFDHALGTLQGVRGFNDPRAIRQSNGNSVFVQTDASGNSFAPWRLDIKDTKITWMGSIPHSRDSQVDAWNEGQYNRWIDAKRSHNHDYSQVPITMGHYTREDLPFYYALADAFTVCDQSFCGGMTSTTPNRCLFWTGTVRDAQNTFSKVYMRNNEIDQGGMSWKTFPERLQEAGVPWKFYQNDLWCAGGYNGEEKAWLSNFGLNIMEFFGAYNVQANPRVVLGLQEEIAALEKRIPKLQARLEHEQNPQAAAGIRASLTGDKERLKRFKFALANSGPDRYKKLSASERALFDNAFVTNAADADFRTLEPLHYTEASEQQQMLVPKGDILHQFRKDVNEGKLPLVSWLGAPERFSDHPTSPWYGAWYVSEVMDILTKNPEVWKKTIFILTYDENDGYFDHVPSFAAADPRRPETGGASAGIDTGIEYTYAADELRQNVAPEEARTGPIGMGFRVPTVVASPWSRGGWVNSQLFDHTSTLMFLEDFVQHKTGKKVVEENISAWRRAISGDLTSCFRAHDAKEPNLDYLNRDKFVIGIREARDKEIPSNYVNLNSTQIADINANPHRSQFTSHQEPGIRPACALPYELYAEGSLSGDRTKFKLNLKAGNEIHGARSSGAPFNVYLRNRKDASGHPAMQVATYAVKPGDTMIEEFPLTTFADGQVWVEVHGPNGFYREFRGAVTSAAPQVHLAYERRGSHATGDVQIMLRNPTKHPLGITIRDNAYKRSDVKRTINAGRDASIVLPLQSSHGWYDFSVLSEGSDAEARYAGRVETGQSSFSDPLMGGMA
jgi:phospholipase C